MSIVWSPSFFYLLMGLVGILSAFSKPQNKHGTYAILFFIAIYITTEIPFRVYGNPGYPDKFLILAAASLALILLYNFLDVTLPLLIAWNVELGIIVLNLINLMVDFPPIVHWKITVILNYCGFLLLIWNRWNGNRVIYRRRDILDKVRHGFRLLYRGSKTIQEKGSKMDRKEA